MGLFFLTALLIVVFFTTKLEILDEWAATEESHEVLANHSWTISFSEKLDLKTVTNGSIYVTDSRGKKLKTVRTLSSDGKAIMIEPPKGGYDVHQSLYKLHINGEIRSQMGRKLGKEVNVPFAVRESLPVIGSHEKLNEYFTNVMMIQKEKENENLKGAVISESIASEDRAVGGENKSANYSETNVQVDGIDEGDMVKTDGTYIYQIADAKVKIIKAVPANLMELESTISFDSTTSPNQLFIHGDQLVVISSEYEQQDAEPVETALKMVEDRIFPLFQSTKVRVYDIQDRKKPNLSREVEVEGTLVSSRKMDGKIYLISTHQPDYWILENKNNTETDLRPRFYDSNSSNDFQTVDFNDIQYFPKSESPVYNQILAFDLERPSEKIHLTTYLGGGEQLYMSDKNLYITLSNSNYSTLLTDVNDARSTDIYKFSINETGVDFKDSTKVKGRILNQFSMDEYNGFFRVATTEGNTWDEEKPSANHLYILDEKLQPVGQIANLARGERIYSARFINDRIYLVTFKETDPLFVIDASVPKEPKVLGELKIPGFSNYLHPYDENHLIGFGMDTKMITNKEQGNEPQIITSGVKFSLFDVSDVSRPREKFSETIGGQGTYSPLNYDHKALLFDKEKNIFAFPINVYENAEGSEVEQQFRFQGAYVYNIDINKGLTLKKQITHLDENSSYEEWESEIQRLLYIGDTIYAISNGTISGYDLRDDHEVGKMITQ
jgi:inhibitor of cysteine peptidase